MSNLIVPLIAAAAIAYAALTGFRRAGSPAVARRGGLAVVAALVLAACGSNAEPKAAPPKPAPKPPHAITVTLALTGADPFEPAPGGCRGTGPLDYLTVGAPVQVTAGGKTVGSGTFTTSKNWIGACTLTGTIEAVPAAPAYKFTVGGQIEGTTVPYADVAKTWTVPLRL